MQEAKEKYALFVGGCADGHRCRISGEPPVYEFYKPKAVMYSRAYEPPPVMEELGREIYVLTRFGSHHTLVYRFKDLPVDEMIITFLNGYRNPKPHNGHQG